MWTGIALMPLSKHINDSRWPAKQSESRLSASRAEAHLRHNQHRLRKSNGETATISATMDDVFATQSFSSENIRQLFGHGNIGSANELSLVVLLCSNFLFPVCIPSFGRSPDSLVRNLSSFVQYYEDGGRINPTSQMFHNRTCGNRRASVSDASR
jgi:hypothetical protein